MIIRQGGAARAATGSFSSRVGYAVIAIALVVVGGCQACAGSIGDGVNAVGRLHGAGAPGAGACTSDAMCPCGTFCDPGERVCRAACMRLAGFAIEGCVARSDARCPGPPR